VARHILVYQEVDGEALYEAPFGSESAVRESWSEPAATLELPLLASIYDIGFYHGIRWSGSELRQVLEELVCLEAHWTAGGQPSDVLADLIERAGYLRAAVTLA
jgi:hypothetical protein